MTWELSGESVPLSPALLSWLLILDLVSAVVKPEPFLVLAFFVHLPFWRSRGAAALIHTFLSWLPWCTQGCRSERGTQRPLGRCCRLWEWATMRLRQKPCAWGVVGCAYTQRSSHRSQNSSVSKTASGGGKGGKGGDQQGGPERPSSRSTSELAGESRAQRGQILGPTAHTEALCGLPPAFSHSLPHPIPQPAARSSL